VKKRILILPELEDRIKRNGWAGEMRLLIGNIYDVDEETQEKYKIRRSSTGIGVGHWSVPKECAEIVDDEKPTRIRWYNKGKLEERYLKTYEQFGGEGKNLVWLTGLPSGEVIQVKKEDLQKLYKEGLIRYDDPSGSKYKTGFYAFDDEDLDLVKRYQYKKELPKPKVNSGKDIIILNNDYDDMLINTLVDIMEDYPSPVELYVQDDCIGISYGDFYIEIMMNQGKQKYELVRRYQGAIKDRYGISTDRQLIDRIESEMNR